MASLLVSIQTSIYKTAIENINKIIICKTGETERNESTAQNINLLIKKNQI